MITSCNTPLRAYFLRADLWLFSPWTIEPRKQDEICTHLASNCQRRAPRPEAFVRASELRFPFGRKSLHLTRTAVNWRDPDAYSHLKRAGRWQFAWEWLRRNPDFRAACDVGKSDEAARFGLIRFEPYTLPAAEAKPLFLREIDKSTLECEVVPSSFCDLFDLSEFEPWLKIVNGQGAEHLLLSDGFQALRLDICSGTITAGPAHLSYRITGVQDAEPAAHAILQLAHLARTHTFSNSVFPVERRAERWITALRVHDAFAEGATHQDIARELYNLGSSGRWRVKWPSYRLRVQRLAAAARRCAQASPAIWFR